MQIWLFLYDMHKSTTTATANPVSRIEGAILQKYFSSYKEMFKWVQNFVSY
jgi:hypothetical protein